MAKGLREDDFDLKKKYADQQKEQTRLAREFDDQFIQQNPELFPEVPTGQRNADGLRMALNGGTFDDKLPRDTRLREQPAGDITNLGKYGGSKDIFQMEDPDNPGVPMFTDDPSRVMAPNPSDRWPTPPKQTAAGAGGLRTDPVTMQAMANLGIGPDFVLPKGKTEMDIMKAVSDEKRNILKSGRDMEAQVRARETHVATQAEQSMNKRRQHQQDFDALMTDMFTYTDEDTGKPVVNQTGVNQANARWRPWLAEQDYNPQAVNAAMHAERLMPKLNEIIAGQQGGPLDFFFRDKTGDINTPIGKRNMQTLGEIGEAYKKWLADGKDPEKDKFYFDAEKKGDKKGGYFEFAGDIFDLSDEDVESLMEIGTYFGKKNGLR